MRALAETFARAVHILVSDGSIKQRLVRAFVEHLGSVPEAALPPSLRREFSGLQSALSRVEPAGSMTRVRASVQKMSPREASAHAETIVRLYVALLSHAERAEPLKVVSSGNDLPRYLTGRG